jgi:hypothetical protein
MRWGTEARFSVSCDRTYEASKNNEPNIMDNCQLVCNICNNRAMWKKETCEGAFLYFDEVNIELSRIKSNPFYHSQDKVMKKLKEMVKNMNFDSGTNIPNGLMKQSPSLQFKDVMPILENQGYSCFYMQGHEYTSLPCKSQLQIQ